MSIEDLRELHRQNKLLPFVGAGVSMAVEWNVPSEGTKRGPSWSEFVGVAAEQLGFESAELLRARAISDLSILEYFAIKRGGFGELTNWFATHMNVPDEALRASPIHKALIALRCKTYYTTNFDGLLERALRLSGRVVHKVVAEIDNHGPIGEDCEVVKFHGDLDRPETMVLSESDYHKRLTFSTAMDFRLLSDILNRVVLFVGYSFRDPNISYLFYRIQEALSAPPNKRYPHRAYILIADPTDFERQLFLRRNICVIPYDGGNHTEGVAALLEEIVG